MKEEVRKRQQGKDRDEEKKRLRARAASRSDGRRIDGITGVSNCRIRSTVRNDWAGTTGWNRRIRKLRARWRGKLCRLTTRRPMRSGYGESRTFVDEDLDFAGGQL